MVDLSGKVIFITGSSSGIGRATALALAKEGVKLAITYLHEEAQADLVAKECKDAGAEEVMLIPLDITSTQSILSAVTAIIQKWETMHCLVNNAGVISWEPLLKQTYEEIDMQIMTNLAGTIKVTKACLPYVKETIVSIGSGAGITAYPNLSVYSATKFGVRGFTQALAKEMSELRIFAVNPGMTATKMTNFQGDKPEAVADIILRLVRQDIVQPTGSDINSWDYI